MSVDTKVAAIARLNDELRRTFAAGHVMLTVSIRALRKRCLARTFLAVREAQLELLESPR